MYCKPMVKTKTPGKQRLYSSDGYTENDIHVVCIFAKENICCVYRNASKTFAQKTLHDHYKFNIDVMPRETYYRYQSTLKQFYMVHICETDTS